MKKQYDYGQMIRATLNTFIKNYNNSKNGSGKNEDKLAESVYKESVEDLKLTNNQLDLAFRGNERNILFLKTIRIFNKEFKNEKDRKRLEAKISKPHPSEY